MPVPSTADELLDLVRKSGLADQARLAACIQKAGFAAPGSFDSKVVADILIRDGLLTTFQAKQILQGKWRRFTIRCYRVLEYLGSGRMGSVYLCDDVDRSRVVAVKVLPTALAADPMRRRRFEREGMCLACLTHANIARAFEIGQDDGLPYLVMEYIPGLNLQQIVQTNGPFEPARAAHYIRQAAFGLKQVHVQGLIHRDIEPGNLIVDRTGTIKIVDFGLSRALDDASLSQGAGNLFTDSWLSPDFAAPELASAGSFDHRADIHSLGATFYFCLAGRPPLDNGTLAEKLDWLRNRSPAPIRTLRPEAPSAMAAVLERMMAKNPADRYQSSGAVVEALAPWTRKRIAPPTNDEMPHWCPATTAAIGRSRTREHPGWLARLAGFWRGRG
jgi:eukaryotic-like serine/threonine-protein kinase